MVSPTQQIDELTHVEQELEDLQNLIRQHFNSVQDLPNLQSQLSTVNQFQETVQSANKKTEAILERLENSQQALSNRASDLEARIQKLTDESSQLKQKMDQILVNCAKEWAQQQESMQLYMEEFENRLQRDVQHAVNRLGDIGANSAIYRERVEKLDIRVRGLSGSVKKMNGTLKAWNGLAIAISVVGLLGFSLLTIVFL